MINKMLILKKLYKFQKKNQNFKILNYKNLFKIVGKKRLIQAVFFKNHKQP